MDDSTETKINRVCIFIATQIIICIAYFFVIRGLMEQGHKIVFSLNNEIDGVSGMNIIRIRKNKEKLHVHKNTNRIEYL